MTARSAFCILTDRKIGLPLCSIACLTGIVLLRQMASIRVAITKATMLDCVHCYMCGAAISRPEDCILHGTECPEWRFDATMRGAQIIEAFAVMTGQPVTEVDLVDCQVMSLVHADLQPVEVVQRIIEQRR